MTSIIPRVARKPVPIDQRERDGRFDIIGDVHGCFDELVTLLERLGYAIADFDGASDDLISVRPPPGRQAVFVGDYADRGPRNRDVYRLVMGMCRDNAALAILGNHDNKLLRWFNGRDVKQTYGLDMTIGELEQTSAEFRDAVHEFLAAIPCHLWLARGRLVVAHAGLPEDMHGEDSSAARAFAMYGDTTGERDTYGFPVRRDWGQDYSGAATVVYGHTPMREAERINNTVCVDQGCVFGGHLSALRWPEDELIQVSAENEYWPLKKPLGLRTDDAA